MGDFNSILRDGDKKNCIYQARDMESFGSFVEMNDLVDVPLRDLHYT